MQSTRHPIVQQEMDRVLNAKPGQHDNVLHIASFRLGQLVASGVLTEGEAIQALLSAYDDRFGDIVGPAKDIMELALYVLDTIEIGIAAGKDDNSPTAT